MSSFSIMWRHGWGCSSIMCRDLWEVRQITFIGFDGNLSSAFHRIGWQCVGMGGRFGVM